VVRVLATLLRLAESLDRSQTQSVAGAWLEMVEARGIGLRVRSAGDCHVELRSLEDQREAFARVFRRPLLVLRD
jgi:hypothetical protein